MKKKISFVIAAIATMMVIGAAQIFAANESLAHAVDLHPYEYVVYSKKCDGTYKYIWGKNSAYSSHSVWFVAEYSYNGGSWTEDKQARVRIYEGESLPETQTYKFGNSHDWRLKVDAYGWYKDCTATGYIRNK